MAAASTTDLRDFPYMPLYGDRLQRSKAWLQCKRDPALAFYMLNLWWRAWHEVPCGSIEDDDDVLADAAMCDPKIWSKIKAKVLRGWEKRDGRLYHSVVTEIAQEAAERKEAQRQRTEAARQKRQQQRDSARDPPVTSSVTRSVTENATERPTKNVTSSVTDNATDIVTSSKGREGKGRDSVPDLRSGAGALDLGLDARQQLWQEGIPILQRILGKNESQTRSFLGGLLKETRDDCSKVLALIRQAAQDRVADPASWLSGCCKRLRAEQEPKFTPMPNGF